MNITKLGLIALTATVGLTLNTAAENAIEPGVTQGHGVLKPLVTRVQRIKNKSVDVINSNEKEQEGPGRPNETVAPLTPAERAAHQARLDAIRNNLGKLSSLADEAERQRARAVKDYLSSKSPDDLAKAKDVRKKVDELVKACNDEKRQLFIDSGGREGGGNDREPASKDATLDEAKRLLREQNKGTTKDAAGAAAQGAGRDSGSEVTKEGAKEGAKGHGKDHHGHGGH